jgi:hypothetical protein
MTRTRSGTPEATKPQVPLTAHREQIGARSLESGAKGKQREYQDWIRRCAMELKTTDGFSSTERFFCAAFSLLFAGKERAYLDREIDDTIDAETGEGSPRLSLQDRLGTFGGGGKAGTEKYVADYFAADEKRNREKRFHDAVLFLFHAGFTREQLHRFAAQAEEN